MIRANPSDPYLPVSATETIPVLTNLALFYRKTSQQSSCAAIEFLSVSNVCLIQELKPSYFRSSTLNGKLFASALRPSTLRSIFYCGVKEVG